MNVLELRKGKLIVFYEWELTLKWKGKKQRIIKSWHSVPIDTYKIVLKVRFVSPNKKNKKNVFKVRTPK